MVCGRGGDVVSRLFLVDTSALVQAELPQVRYTLTALITDRVAATCVFVDLAAGYSGRDIADVSAIDARRRERYVNLPLNEEIADRAREVQRELAATGGHRMIGILDLLTASVAEHHDAVLLHYADSFETIGAVTGQSHLWVAPRGSLEAAAEPAVVTIPAPAAPEPEPEPWPAPAPVESWERSPRPTIDEFLAAKRARDGSTTGNGDVGGSPAQSPGIAAFEAADPVAWSTQELPDR